MALDLPGSWVWDFWTAYDEGRHHLFFLHAPTSLGDPDLRHHHARVGHAVSTDLRTWTRLPDPLPELRDGLDDLAQWTGSVLRAEGGWWLFTSGLSHHEGGLVQRIGAARSTDLVTWERTPLLLEADGRWYHTQSAAKPEEPWRDPWIVRGADERWHLYLTAGDRTDRRACGVVGHAVSDDLLAWTVLPPLEGTSGRFVCLEVVQVVEVDGRWAMLFSAPGDLHSDDEVEREAHGVWSVAVTGPADPDAAVDMATAVRLTGPERYVGKVVHHDGRPHFLAFRHFDGDRWLGGIADPVPVRWREDGAGLLLG